ncbi:acyl-CoA dehydrogenase family protein [Pseudomonas izuensis]|uniref:Acyl-CoA dehydrogenase family protein n=1 Tax=Pseudomonas izuensis TaxID=2684212 RepID=A0ABM7RQB7_9PSED|nr:acyl-CoA dehydrogenase [Pseudomonas izuensis]BCX67870.1 acyl-CoA dehydrogenase family protein [Pseudomonas izuensis]
MNFELTDEHKLLAESAERYMRERYVFEERRHTVSCGAHFSRKHWQHFAEMGWLALDIAEADGGVGASSFELTQLMEPLGHGLLLEPVVDTAVLCARILGTSDNTGERQRLLESIATGETVMALAHQEQDARNEYQVQLHSSARRVADGWALNGQKHRVFHGGVADSFLVSAILEDSNETALFVVDRAAVGMTANTYELIDGSRAADLHLQDIQVTDANLLLRGAAVQQAIEAGLDRAILALCAASVGSMEAVMAMTADYLKTRVQYGKPLAQFQALQHRMAEMFVETDQARAMLFSAINAFDSGDVETRRQAVSGAKVFIARAHYFVASQGIQLHGGIGTTDEYAVGHHYKAAVLFEKRFGDSDFHLTRAAGNLQEPVGGALYA